MVYWFNPIGTHFAHCLLVPILTHAQLHIPLLAVAIPEIKNRGEANIQSCLLSIHHLLREGGRDAYY